MRQQIVKLYYGAEILLTVALEKRQGMKSNNTHACMIVGTFGHYIWKAIAPEPSNEGIPNVERKVRRVCGINQKPSSCPVIYTYGASLFSHTCRLTIHHLPYLPAWVLNCPHEMITNMLTLFSMPRLESQVCDVTVICYQGEDDRRWAFD